MLYCFSFKNLKGNKRVNAEIEEAMRLDVFIYYDKDKDVFLDKDDNPVDIKNKEVIPITGILQMKDLFNALMRHEAILLNSLNDINIVKEWYKHIITKRKIVSFKGKMLNDTNFLEYLKTVFNKDQVFLKTKEKDYNGTIDFSLLFDPESDLRKAFEYHQDDEFILSDVVNLNNDEYGRIEYRIFVMKGKIMNISRVVDEVYHPVDSDAIDYVMQVLDNLPDLFPTTFVIDIFKHDNVFDILEFNPFEGSGKYLYNSIFTFSDDLIHEDIENVPNERKYLELTYDFVEKKLTPSTLKDVKGTFAKDLSDIERFGERVNGMVFVEGFSGKINLSALLGSMQTIETDEELFGTPKEEEKSLDEIINEINLSLKKNK